MNINIWLEEKGFGQYSELFEKSGITLDELFKITTLDELKKVGIKSVVIQKKILSEINDLSTPTNGGAAPSFSSNRASGKSQTLAHSSSRKGTSESIQRLHPSTQQKLNEYEETIIKNIKELNAKITELGEEHEEVSDCYYELGTNYYMNEQYDRAIANHKKSLDIRIKCYGEDDIDVVISYYQLGLDYYMRKKYKQAILNYKKALDIQIELNEDDDHNEGVGSINFDLGKAYYYDDQYEKAITSHEKALEIRQYVFDENHMDVVNCYYQLGLDYYQDDQYNKAITNHKNALEMLLSTFVEKSEDISNCYYQLGSCYLSNDQYESAITNFKDAIKIRKELFGNNHINVAECILGLGKTLSMQNKNKKAIEIFNLALSIYENVSENKKIAECNASLGISYFEIEQEEEALTHLKIAWKLFVETLGETSNKAQEMKSLIDTLEVEVDESPEVETKESNTKPANEESYNEDIEKYISEGNECIENKKYTEALMHYENALKLSNIALEDDEKTETVANINFKLGTTNKHLEEYVEAEDYLHKAISGFVGLHGKNYFDSARSYSQLGDVYYYINDYKNAIINHKKALESYSNLEEDSLTAWSHYDLGLDYYWTEEYEQSIDHLFQALDIRLKLYGKMHKQVVNCYNRLGLSYYWDNQNEKAIKYHKLALEIREHLFGTESEDFDDSRFSLAKAYYYSNMENEAKECFSSSLKFRKKQFGKNSKQYNKAKEWLEKI